MNDQDRRTKRWRKHAPCGCVLLMFVVGLAIPVIGWITWSVNAARVLEDELAAIRDVGEPIEPADLVPFYAIPPGEADTTRLWVKVSESFGSPRFGEAIRDLPIVGIGPDIPPLDEPWDQLQAIEMLLEDYKDEMDSVHEAAKLGGYARFDRDFEQGVGLLLPHVQQLRTVARMLTLEARVAARRGDAHGVAQSIHAMFATSQAIAEDPILVSNLVRIAIAGVAIGELQVALESVAFSDADLQMLRKDVQAVDFQRGLERSLMGERVIGILTFRNPGQYVGAVEMSLPLRSNNEDLALYLSTFSKYLNASRQPFPQALALSGQATQELQDVIGDSPVNHLRYVFTSSILPAVDAVFEANARGASVTTCADTALAIEQFRRLHGKPPATLAELVPEYLGAVPMDPIDGKPMRYVVSEDGYVLYSVGRNRVDDGGVVGDDRLDEVFSVKVTTGNGPAKATP